MRDEQTPRDVCGEANWSNVAPTWFCGQVDINGWTYSKFSSFLAGAYKGSCFGQNWRRRRYHPRAEAVLNSQTWRCFGENYILGYWKSDLTYRSWVSLNFLTRLSFCSCLNCVHNFNVSPRDQSIKFPIFTSLTSLQLTSKIYVLKTSKRIIHVFSW